ncbi:hypothetical protein ACWDYK_01565 [Streptomyces anthocyanicus]|uniref:hypothetical protein n=2 Tax=Streptomyces TaxID=1883 RepID=UPI000A3F9BD3|nr:MULTISPECIES: hypothetical protein [Streptomyces]
MPVTAVAFMTAGAAATAPMVLLTVPAITTVRLVLRFSMGSRVAGIAVTMASVAGIAVSLVLAAAASARRTVVVPSGLCVATMTPVVRLPVGRHLRLAAMLPRCVVPVGSVRTDVRVVRCAQPGPAGIENRCHLADRRHLHANTWLRHVLPQPIHC